MSFGCEMLTSSGNAFNNISKVDEASLRSIAFKIPQQSLQLIPPRNECLRYGTLVEFVNAPEGQAANQRKNAEYGLSQRARVTFLPGYRPQKCDHADGGREQVPPENIFQQPDLMIHLSQVCLKANLQG